MINFMLFFATAILNLLGVLFIVQQLIKRKQKQNEENINQQLRQLLSGKNKEIALQESDIENLYNDLKKFSEEHYNLLEAIHKLKNLTKTDSDEIQENILNQEIEKIQNNIHYIRDKYDYFSEQTNYLWQSGS